MKIVLPITQVHALVLGFCGTEVAWRRLLMQVVALSSMISWVSMGMKRKHSQRPAAQLGPVRREVFKSRRLCEPALVAIILFVGLTCALIGVALCTTSQLQLCLLPRHIVYSKFR